VVNYACAISTLLPITLNFLTNRITSQNDPRKLVPACPIVHFARRIVGIAETILLNSLSPVVLFHALGTKHLLVSHLAQAKHIAAWYLADNPACPTQKEVV
jgi:hypothetical protein